ncbi:MAG: membrane protein insertase YidC [Treponema sp.]|nr:membrane protein insertase YidC [Treponema sp.]
MEKRTLLALVLIMLIVMGSSVIRTMFFPVPESEPAGPTESVLTTPDESYAHEDVVFTTTENEFGLTEQTIVITTDHIRATFTNNGGNMTGCELLDHIDTDTGKGIEMADNVSAFNRAHAVTLGGVDGTALSGLFSVSQPDDYTVLFTKTISVADTTGQMHDYVFGKRYTFLPDEYMYRLEILIHSIDGAPALDFAGAAYTLRTAPQMGPHYFARNRYEYRHFIGYDGRKVRRVPVGTNQFKEYEHDVQWIGIAGKYFEALIVPEDPNIVYKKYYSSRIEVNDYANAQGFLVRKAYTGSDVHDTYYLYCGPCEEKQLIRYNNADNNGWQLSNRYLNSTLSSTWLAWLETILKWIMQMLYKLVPNWGVSIILMTVLLKLALFPLTRNQSMSTLKMQAVQPRIQELQHKYKDNPQKLQEESAKLYKEAGINPMSGCLPLLFQFLIIFAMYHLFNNYFEFRGASFIPGWIPDLSAGDKVYTFSRSIPVLGDQLHILPIIYLASQLLYGVITQNGGTAATNNGQMKFMMFGMPIIFFFIFYTAPSGLLIYWTVSNVIQLLQQLIISRIMKNKKNATPVDAVKPVIRSKRR